MVCALCFIFELVDLAACDEEISGLVTEKKSMEKTIANKELQAKKLSHKIGRTVSDAEEAKKLVAKMAQKHPWIVQVMFGVFENVNNNFL